MRLRKSSLTNPLSFSPWPVTIITTLFYVALIAALVAVHVVVPKAPKNRTPVNGINLTEAWEDLQELTNGFRPYNSRRNDVVRSWLLGRIETIMAKNGVAYASDALGSASSTSGAGMGRAKPQSTPDPAIIFNDLVSNVTFAGNTYGSSSGGKDPVPSVYFEGTNIIVYIRGSEDDPEQSWSSDMPLESSKASRDRGGVLVNAHYDSVSTGYGATDDGMGVITVLQLVKYYTTKGNTPRKGLVLLLNNGEEDFLNGAIAFSQHPISKFPNAFLNLEGAGAGGRATLFRSTDTEITQYYRRSPYPYGTVISRDGFERGLIRSQTDYVVLNGVLGMRGLDVAFTDPRARYHTDEDDARHTSIDSLWHMLSAALSTTQGLTSETTTEFARSSRDEKETQTDKSTTGGTDGVWFDLFGRTFAVFRLHTLFAISVTLLVATPIILVLLSYLLYRKERFYYFSSKVLLEDSASDEPVKTQGWRGFTRFIITLIVATAAVIALAFLLTKVNTFIVYSSQYSVWAMMMSAWLVVTWFLLTGADFVRPSALQRGYALMWLYILSWIALVFVAVSEDRLHLAGGYFIVIYVGACFTASLVGLLECFALPRKTDFATEQNAQSRQREPSRSGSLPSSTLIAPSADEAPRPSNDAEEDEDGNNATETTPLFRGRGQTFANYSRSRQRSGDDADASGDDEEQSGIEEKGSLGHQYGEEQAWSGKLPTWTWVFQLILLVPINVILIGQIGLLFSTAMYQTGADGSSSLLIYLGIAFFTTLILAPVGPFIHRFTHHIPTFLFFVFLGTLIYNLVAFPFSANNRLKLYFVQNVDLESGINQVSLLGSESYVRRVINTVPSAAGQKIECSSVASGRAGLQKCGWRGLAPKVVPNGPSTIPPELRYADWIHYNVSRVENANEAKFQLYGRNSRSCRILFHSPISDFRVKGAVQDKRFKAVSDNGSKEIRLWSRDWEKPWEVDVKWAVSEGKQLGDEGLDGKVVCIWSDDNEPAVIPALDELRRYAPGWVAFTKASDGLVEGEKKFMV
ncbi:MAG: 60S ribosomal protein L16B [Chaenotheca gracillima]|nr:MAG: 60S ribosomal protein L16B [Chaenotheca gracillima]